MSYQRKVSGIFRFYYFFLYYSLVRNENIERPGFCTLPAKRFSQSKQLNKISVNVVIFLNSDLLEQEIRGSYRNFTVTMFLSVFYD